MSGAKKRRFSLGFKWTAIVGTGIFATFIVFSWVMFGAFRQILVSQEHTTVNQTLAAVVQRLAPIATPLNADTVANRLEIEGGAPDHRFADTVVQKLAAADLSLAVYTPNGQLLFSSRHQDQPLKRVTTTTLTPVQTKTFDGLVGAAPIVSSATGERLGYVQLTDNMGNFHRTMRQVTNLIWALCAVALLVSLGIGFILARRFLKPIRQITATIAVVNEEPQSSVRIPTQKQNDELGDLVIAFNGMLDRMQQFIDQQSDFVQDVSHELRTPVAILEGHLQLLNRWGKDDQAVLDESLAASLQEVTRMKALIQEMLDLTRADQVDVQFPNAVTDVQQLLGQVVHDFQLIHPDFVFIEDVDLAGPTWVRIYRNHLEQVLIILLDNAVKYSLTRKEIHVSAATDTDGVALVVQDFGEGLSEADRTRVFNRFYRVDKARSREKGGNGLGLAIAQQLVESYHGTITVDSVKGHGAAFRVDLPLIAAATAERLRNQADQKPEASAADELRQHSNL